MLGYWRRDHNVLFVIVQIFDVRDPEPIRAINDLITSCRSKIFKKYFQSV